MVVDANDNKPFWKTKQYIPLLDLWNWMYSWTSLIASSWSRENWRNNRGWRNFWLLDSKLKDFPVENQNIFRKIAHCTISNLSMIDGNVANLCSFKIFAVTLSFVFCQENRRRSFSSNFHIKLGILAPKS